MFAKKSGKMTLAVLLFLSAFFLGGAGHLWAVSSDGTGTHNASGTYTWDAITGVTTLNWTSSDFICDGPDLGAEQQTGVTVAATTMTWANDNMTWTRSSGAVGDIVGIWTSTDSGTGNSYTLTFNTNGTVSVTAEIVACGGGGEGQNPSAHSQHWSNGYYVQLQYHDSPKTATAVSVTGPGIEGSTALVYDAGYGSWNSWTSPSTQVFFGTTSPSGLPFDYTFTITDTTTWTATPTVFCFQESFATNLSPTGSVAGTPTFSWTGIAYSSAIYGVELHDNTGNSIWNNYDISGTSIVYNGPPLTAGMTYNYNVVVQGSSACSNGASFAQGSFTYESGGGATPHPEAATIQARFEAALAAYNDGDFTTFAAFISESYLDGGENKEAFLLDVQADRDPTVPLTWTIHGITGTGSDAVMQVTWGGESEILYFRKEGALWMLYGNQKLFWAEANSGHQIYPQSSQPYWVSLSVEDPAPALGITVTRVNVTGPGLPPSVGIDLYHDETWQSWHSWGQNPSQENLGPSFSAAPAMPLDYTFTISYTGGPGTSPDVQTVQLQSFVNAAPDPGTLAPQPGADVTGTLTFSWGSAGTGYTYTVELNDPNYNRLWEKRDLTGTSVVYDGDPLAPGQYSYTIVTRDSFGNSSFVTTMFNVVLTTPYYTVNIVENNIKVIKGQKAEFVLNIRFFNNYSTAQGIGFTTDQPSLSPFFVPVPAKNPGGVVMKIDTANLEAGAYQGTLQYGEVGSDFTGAIPFTLQVVRVTDIKFYDWIYNENTQTYDKTEISQIEVTRQGSIDFWSSSSEATVSDGSLMMGAPLAFTGNAPSFISVHKSNYGYFDFYAEGANGAATVNAVAPDGFTRVLNFNINIPATPRITSIGLAPMTVTNKYADEIGFSATGTDAIGYGSQGWLAIKEDTRTWYDQNRSVSGTFKLDLATPPDLGTYLFSASISGGTGPQTQRVAPLTIVNDPSYAMIRGGVKLLDASIPYYGMEGFTLEFYNDLGVKQFSREYWSYAHDGGDPKFEIGAIPPGTYKIKFVPAMSSIRPQWWPNAEDINGALPVDLAAGQVKEDIYFFARFAPTISFTGAVRDSSVTSPITGNPIADASVTVLGTYSSGVTTDASGNFILNEIPIGQPFTIYIEKSPDYIPVYSGEISVPVSIESPWPFVLLTPSEVATWQVSGQNLWQTGKGMITSRVVSSTNPAQTIEGAQISVASSMGNTYGITYFDGTSFGGMATADNGLFYIYGVEPGDTVTVTASQAGWAFNTNIYTVRYESISEQLLFGVQGGQQTLAYNGAVMDKDGRPIAGATIEVVGSDPLISATSDGAGNFTLYGISAGQDFHLRISMPGYASTYSGNTTALGNIMAGNRPFILLTAEQIAGLGVTPGKGVIGGGVVDGQDPERKGISGVVVTAQGSSKSYPVAYRDEAGNTRTDRTYGNGQYFVLNVDSGDTVTVTAQKPSWKFPTKVFAVHADSISQGGFPGVRTLAGIWGGQDMGREADGSGGYYRWAEAGTLAFADNPAGPGGTVTYSFTRNENGTILTDTENFAYTALMRNGDGTYTLMMPLDGATTEPNPTLAISDDGSMVILNGAQIVGDRRLDILVRTDPVKTHGNIDLSGDYYGIGYEHNATQVSPPDGNGANMAISSIQTFNGAGSYTYIGQANSDGTIWTDDQRTTARSYTVQADGAVSVQNGAFLGYLSGNGKILTGSGSYTAGAADTWVSYVFLKKADKIYSPADLAGIWDFAGYGDDQGNVRSSFGRGTCDASGICNISGKTLRDDGLFDYFGFTETLTVAADGSFGHDAGSPVPLGAIGNGGKTIILNRSFDENNRNNRMIIVAVKTGNAIVSPINNPVWAGTHNDGGSYYADFVVADPGHTLTSVTVSGPGINGSLNLTYRNEAGAWWTVPQPYLGNVPPVFPGSYYSITMSDGMNHTVTVQQRLSGGVDAFATDLSPTGEQTGKITFGFTGITGAEGYMVHLFDANGNMIWQSDRILATSIPYGGPPLPSGAYNYLVHSWIGNNSSVARASFNYTVPVQYPAGDVNHDKLVDLADAIIALRVVAGLGAPVVFADGDVDHDGGIGMAEALFVVQTLAGLRVTDRQAAIDGVQAALDAYKTLINARGTAVTDLDLLPFFHPAYLDDGMNRYMAARDELPDGLLHIDTLSLSGVLFFDDVRKIITVEIIFAGAQDGNPASETFAETFAYDPAIGKWLMFGNQRIGEFSVWLGTSRTMPAGGGISDSLIFHPHFTAPQGTVSQVAVSGPALTGTLVYGYAGSDTQEGFNIDRFALSSQGGTEVLFSQPTPQVGDTYTMTVTKTGGGTITYRQSMREVMLEAAEITLPASHDLAAANIGNQIAVSWTLPDSGISLDNVRLEGQVCNANGCNHTVGDVTSPTGGTITLPAMDNPTSAYIDVRVHYKDEIFTNCRFEFN